MLEGKSRNGADFRNGHVFLFLGLVFVISRAAR
jgi:hypothetical protein